ncbi:MAG: hypothetical protein JWN70_3866 [Planctomycetaceae bacterium]|nr:hypothetical protein [Planctomycetaceae bacterium]
MQCRCVMSNGLFLIAVMLLSCGCGGDNVRKTAVKGEVLLDGKPVPQGRITFEPTGGTTGPASGASIKNGAFEISAENGVTVGKNLVRINSNKPTGKKVKSSISSDMLDETVEGIPEKYNSKSKLEKEIEEGPNEISFDLES